MTDVDVGLEGIKVGTGGCMLLLMPYQVVCQCIVGARFLEVYGEQVHPLEIANSILLIYKYNVV